MKRVILPLLLLAACGPRVERMQKAIDKGRHHKIERKAEKKLRKKADRLTVEQKEALHDVWGSAIAADLRLEPRTSRAHWFLEEFPQHFDRSQILEMAASMALRDVLEPAPDRPAVADSREAALLALSRAYWPSPSAKKAAEIAAEERLSALRAGERDPWSYQEYQLRYPSVDVAQEATDAAVTWAQEAESPDAWQRVLDAYPDHPDRAEMISTYRKLAWDRIERGGETQSAVWAFARRFHGSEEAKLAVAKGLDIAASVELDNTRPINTLAVLFDSAPPAGYGLRVRLELGGEPWSAVAPERSRKAAPLEPPFAFSEDTVTEGARVSWSTSVPLCRQAEGEQFELVVSLHEGDEELASRRLPVPVERTCAPTRRMAFSNEQNDVDGPLAIVTRQADGSWDLEEPLWRLPESAECTHITRVSERGAEVECGRLEILAGWNPDEFWVRETDSSQRRTERVPLTVVGSGSGPLGLKGRGSHKRLVDARKKTVAQLGERDAVVVESPSATSLGGTCPSCEGAGSPALSASLDVPSGGGAPMPEGATVSSDCPDVRPVPAGEWQLLDDHGLIRVSQPEAEDGWEHLLVVPGRPQTWQCFLHEGHLYSRSVTVQSGRVRVLTLRDAGTRWVVDVTSMR